MIKKNLRGRRRSNKVSKTFRLPFSQTNAACNAEYSPKTKIIQIFRFFILPFSQTNTAFNAEYSPKTVFENNSDISSKLSTLIIRPSDIIEEKKTIQFKKETYKLSCQIT